MDGPEIWRTALQHCCGDACQISGPSSKSTSTSRPRDLISLRICFLYWNGSLSLSKHHRNGFSHLVLPCSVFLALTPSRTKNTDAYSFDVSQSVQYLLQPEFVCVQRSQMRIFTLVCTVVWNCKDCAIPSHDTSRICDPHTGYTRSSSYNNNVNAFFFFSLFIRFISLIEQMVMTDRFASLGPGL